MSNQAVELHDSSVIRIAWDGRTLVLTLAVSMHQSDGDPARDRGTGWSQAAELRIQNAALRETPPLPLWILDGVIAVGLQTYDDLLPLPFDQSGSVVVMLTGAEGTLRVTGVAAALTLLGEPTLVEEFPGAS